MIVGEKTEYGLSLPSQITVTVEELLSHGNACVCKVRYNEEIYTWKCFDPRYSLGLRARYGVGEVEGVSGLSESQTDSTYLVRSPTTSKHKVFAVDLVDERCQEDYLAFVKSGQAQKLADRIAQSHSSRKKLLDSLKLAGFWSPEKEVCLHQFSQEDCMKEWDAYKGLKSLQGLAVHRVVAHVKTTSWKEVSSGHRPFFEHFGTLMEWIDGFPLYRTLPELAAKLSLEEFLDIVRETVKVVNLLPYFGPFIFRKLTTKNILVKRERIPGKPFMLLIDLVRWKNVCDPVYFRGDEGMDGNTFEAHARADQEGKLLLNIAQECNKVGLMGPIMDLASQRFRYFTSVSFPIWKSDEAQEKWADMTRHVLWEESMDKIWLPKDGESAQDLWAKIDNKIEMSRRLAAILNDYVDREDDFFRHVNYECLWSEAVSSVADFLGLDEDKFFEEVTDQELVTFHSCQIQRELLEEEIGMTLEEWEARNQGEYTSNEEVAQEVENEHEDEQSGGEEEADDPEGLPAGNVPDVEADESHRQHTLDPFLQGHDFLDRAPGALLPMDVPSDDDDSPTPRAAPVESSQRSADTRRNQDVGQITEETPPPALLPDHGLDQPTPPDGGAPTPPPVSYAETEFMILNDGAD